MIEKLPEWFGTGALRAEGPLVLKNKVNEIIDAVNALSAKRSSKFVPPTLAEVAAYCFERGAGVNAVKWYDHYTANGWMVGRTKMKDWRAAVRKWEPQRSADRPVQDEGRL